MKASRRIVLIPAPFSLDTPQDTCLSILHIQKDDQLEGKWSVKSNLWCASEKAGPLYKLAGTIEQSVCSEQDCNSFSSELLWECWLSAASPRRVIQHLPHQKAVTTETLVCVIRLLLLCQKEIGCRVCLPGGPLCVSSERCLFFFLHVHIFLQPSFCRDYARYWFIISDPDKILVHYFWLLWHPFF